MKIIQDFIPRGKRNRPGNIMTPRFITIHETGNPRRGANAKAHAEFLKSPASDNPVMSWHFSVDEAEIYQHLPLNENGWHAGDGGNGTGNRQSIGIEICVNADGDFAKAVKLTQELVKKLMTDHKIPINNVVQHWHWTKKNCPENIRRAPNGWKNFIDGIDEPEWKKILRAKLDRPDDWIQWIESQSSHPLARWLPDLILKISS